MGNAQSQKRALYFCTALYCLYSRLRPYHNQFRISGSRGHHFCACSHCGGAHLARASDIIKEHRSTLFALFPVLKPKSEYVSTNRLLHNKNICQYGASLLVTLRSNRNFEEFSISVEANRVCKKGSIKLHLLHSL